MMNLDPFSQHNNLRQMQDRHAQMMQEIRHRQKSFRAWFVLVFLLIIAGLLLFGYVGYKLLTHFGVL